MSDADPALTGVAVIEISQTLAASVAARLLAEAGADVIEVEPPGGDPLRADAPVGFASWNRSKRAVTLDLDDPHDRAALDRLLERADVLVHDLTPQRADAVALGADLNTRHPHLIIGGVTGYPAWHPRRDEPAEEILVQATSGVMDEQQGNRAGPIVTRMPYATWCAAFLLAGGLLARLVQRARTGVVGDVRTSLLQGVLVPTAMYWQRSERLPAALDEAHTLPKVWPGASLSLFECADGGWIQLAGALGGWIESPPVLEALALRDEVELSEIGVSAANRPRWQAVFRAHDAATWLALFTEVDVPCMLVRDLGDCFADEQARVNDYVVDVDDPTLGRTTQAGPPFTTDPPCQVRGAAPAQGRRGVEDVLADFGRPDHPAYTRADAGTAAPLDGVTVLDFGTMVAAPFAAQCFADLGARVVKVERLDGDRGRTLTQFAGANRGKASVAIDLKHADAAAPLARLVSTADVVVHNIRAGAARRLGLDLDGLRALNERVVLTHVSANGGRGPMSGYPGYDPTAQAMTGWERTNVGAGRPPMWMRNSVLDVCGGLAAFVGGLLGLYRREVTGVAGSSGSSLLATGMTIASETALDATGRPYPVPQIDPDQTGTSPYARIHETRTGWFAVAARTPAQRAALDAAVGDGGPAGLAGADRADVLARLGAAGVPAAAVALDQSDAFFDDPAHRRHGLARRLEAADYGTVDVVGGFWTLSGDDAVRDGETLPSLGADTVAVLLGLGYDDEQVAALVADQIVHDGTVRT